MRVPIFKRAHSLDDNVSNWFCCPRVSSQTSVTINGVRYVVDGGLVKKRVFLAKTSMECLTTVPISQAEAWQRTGRAGREQSGECTSPNVLHFCCWLFSDVWWGLCVCVCVCVCASSSCCITLSPTRLPIVHGRFVFGSTGTCCSRHFAKQFELGGAAAQGFGDP